MYEEENKTEEQGRPFSAVVEGPESRLIHMDHLGPINTLVMQYPDKSWHRFDPETERFVRDDSIPEYLDQGPEQVVPTAALVVQTCKDIKNLFDSGCTHAMVCELRYL